MLKVKQYNVGPWPGAVMDLYSRTGVFINVVSNIMLAATFYATGGRAFLQLYFPWMNFWVFLALLISSYLTAMVLYYVFIMPSSLSFVNRQWYMHKNPVQKDLDEIKKELEEIKKALNIPDKKAK